MPEMPRRNLKKELDPKNIGVDGYEYWEDIEKDYKPIKGENKI